MSGWNYLQNALRACEFMDILDVPVWKSDIVVKVLMQAIFMVKMDSKCQQIPPRVRTPKIPLSSDELLEKLTKKHADIQILTLWPLTNIARLIKNEFIQRESYLWAVLFVFLETSLLSQSLIFLMIQILPIKYLLLFIIASFFLSTSRGQLIFTRHEMQTILRWLKWKKSKISRSPLTLHTFQNQYGFPGNSRNRRFPRPRSSVIAMLIYPHLFYGQFLPIRVETKGEFTRGQTVTDLRNVAQPNTHTFVVTKSIAIDLWKPWYRIFLVFL